ncbi:MAG: FeoB small GTPase domain-containing protein, partial [Chloroflexota bacterium]
MKILLMGNPNVGKSVIFSRLTGVRVIASNYPGTTVSYTHGFTKIGDERAEVFDVPGTYTLEPTSEAEEVALNMLHTGDVVVNVVNAINLERNLYLTLELLERDVPVVVALNMWDDTAHYGIHLNVERLQELLGVPVVPTVAVSGEGIRELVEALPRAVAGKQWRRSHAERWAEIGRIVEEVQSISHRHHRWFERLADASVKPFSGTVIALAVLAGAFFTVRFIGEGLIDYVLDPLFNRLWAPVLMDLSQALGGGGVAHAILIGKITEGGIDFVQSFGVLS